jgi:hypothetical protein
MKLENKEGAWITCDDGKRLARPIIICRHIVAGAPAAHLITPEEAGKPDDWTGEALCAACHADPPEDIADYEFACWDCLEKMIANGNVLPCARDGQ